MCGIAKGDPDHAISLLNPVRSGPRLFRRRLVGVGRNAYALTLAVVGPAVVGADEAIILNPTKRQTRAPVKAQVSPGQDLALETPQHDILPQHTRS